MIGRATRTAVLARTLTPGPADADLLAAFLDRRDEAAFAALVRRHGPLVRSACRHLLRDDAAADDAFQATFVALVRKAGGLRRHPSLAGWLFGAARNCARHLRRATDRRDRRERLAARPEPIPAPDPSWREACAVLHAEIDRLPEPYRLPLVLCYLQGLSRDEAAVRLGWTVNEVRGRLERGRVHLRARLERRGITLSAGLLAAVAAGPLTPVLVRAAVSSVNRPSPRVAEVAAAATTAGRAKVAGFALAAAVLVGTVVLGAGNGAPPAADPPAKEKPPAVARVDAHGDPLPDGAVARLGTMRFNHGEGLKALLYTPDGKTVVSVGNGTARVWDAVTGAERLQFSTGSAEWDEQAVISPDGKELVLLLQRFAADPVRRFDLASGKPVVKEVTLPIRRGQMSVNRRNALSPDGRLAVLNDANGIIVYDATTRTALWGDPYGSNLTGIRPADGGQLCLAFAGPDRLVTALGTQIQVREARTGTKVREFYAEAPVGALVSSPDGKSFAGLARNPADGVNGWPEKDLIRLWDAATGKVVHELTSGPKQAFMNLVFAPDGKSLAAYSQSPTGAEVTVFDTVTGRPTTRLPGATGQVLAFSPDGKRLAVGPNVGKFDVYDLATGKAVGPAGPIGWWAGAVHLSRTGDRAVTVAKNAVTTWDATTGRELQSTAVPDLLFEKPWCRLSPDGRYALLVQVTDKDGSIVVWDVAAARAVHTIPVKDQPYGITPAFSPDSTRLALRMTGEKPPIIVHDLKSGKEVGKVQLPKMDYPGQPFFADDGQTLIVTGKRTVGYRLSDGAERFAWTMDPEPSQTNMGIGVAGGGGVQMEADRLAWRSLVVSPDGTLAVCVLSAGWGPEAKLADRLLLLDARTGKVLRRWSDSGKQSNGYEVLAFSPDGRLVASSDKYDVHVWELSTGTKVRTFRGHRNEVEALSFSGNGRRLASAAHDGTVLVWDVCPPSRSDAEPWADLASPDAATGYAAVGRLADATDEVTLPLLRKHLIALTPAERQRIERLVAHLDSDDFRSRDRAFKELAELGHAARPALQAARVQKPSAEAASRIDQLLAKMVGPPAAGQSLRTARAVAALEAKGTPAARALLTELAGGADGWLTTEARAAVRRLEQ